jgi:hypothetical protein
MASPPQGFECNPAEDQPAKTGRERAENVGQIMGSQIDTRKPDEHDQRAGNYYTSKTSGAVPDNSPSEQGQETVKQSRAHRVTAGETVTGKRHKRIFQHRTFAMEKMFQKYVERGAATHNECEQRSVQPITPQNEQQRYGNGNSRQPANRAEE